MLKNKKGMTLVETIVTIAIFSIAALVLVTGFSTVIRYMGEASLLKNTGNEVYSLIEKDEQDSGFNKTQKQVSIVLENNTIHDQVMMYESSKTTTNGTDGDEVKFHKFVREQNEEVVVKKFYELVEEAKNYYNNHKNDWYLEYNKKLEELNNQGVKGLDGYSSYTSNYMTNDRFINYFYIMYMNGDTYPQMEREIIDLCNIKFDQLSGSPSKKVINEVRIGERNMYMKCVYLSDCNEVLIVADEYPKTPKVNQWRTRLIYNPKNKHWYYKMHYAVNEDTTNFYFNVAGLTTQKQYDELLLTIASNTSWIRIDV